HLVYAVWLHRDGTLVRRSEFVNDLDQDYLALEKFGIDGRRNSVFLPSYEWYNQDIVRRAAAEGVQLVNYTTGLRTAADYTYPEMGNRYVSSQQISQQLKEKEVAEGLKGYIILVHLGADDRREDKLYFRLEEIISFLKEKGYTF